MKNKLSLDNSFDNREITIIKRILDLIREHLPDGKKTFKTSKVIEFFKCIENYNEDASDDNSDDIKIIKDFLSPLDDSEELNYYAEDILDMDQEEVLRNCGTSGFFNIPTCTNETLAKVLLLIMEYLESQDRVLLVFTDVIDSNKPLFEVVNSGWNGWKVSETWSNSNTGNDLFLATKIVNND